PTGVSMTPSRALIFVCDPNAERKPARSVSATARNLKQSPQPQVNAAGEPACARQIAENLARRAFRRPVTTEDLNRLMPFYEEERRGAQARQGAASSKDGGTFDQGIEQIVSAVLVSPQFLYRTIRGSIRDLGGATPDTEFPLT